MLGIDRDPGAISRCEGSRGGSGWWWVTSATSDAILDDATRSPRSRVCCSILGMSSRQVDTCGPGILLPSGRSARDMRMGPDAGVSADELVNRTPAGRNWPHLLRNLGEERFCQTRRSRPSWRPAPSRAPRHLAAVVKQR